MVRKRHPVGAATRDTHGQSGIDFSGPSDRLYGSQMDLEAVTVIDLGQGSVTDGAIVEGGLDGGSLIRAGTLPPSSFDTTPPLLPSYIAVTSEMLDNANGTSEVAIVVTTLPPVGGWEDDYFATYIYTTNESDNDPVAPSPVWTRPIVSIMGKGQDVAYVTGVAGATQYWVQLRTVDVMGNYSAPSADYAVMTVSDADAPDVPSGVTGAGGFKAIGVRWEPSSATDLMHNEVRYAPALGGGPDTTAWQIVRTRGTSVYIDALTPRDYYAQVRSVDFSRNTAGRWACTGLASTDVVTCLTHGFVNGDKVHFEDVTGAPEIDAVEDALYVVSATATTFKVSLTLGGAALNFTTNMTGFVTYLPNTAVDYLTDPETGWSLMVGPLTATLVGAADIAFNAVLANIISTGILDASTIQTGILKINTGAGPDADGIQVLYGGNVVGKWDELGLEIRSKTAGRSLLDFIRLDDAALQIFAGGAAQSAITKDGINATAINFGVAAGGHNLVFNSSFELSQFVATSTSAVGSGGSTFAGGVGGWVQVANANATLGAAAISMAAL